jgi:hypothetical protein
VVYLISFFGICFGILTGLLLWMLILLMARPLVQKNKLLLKFFSVLPMVYFFWGGLSTLIVGQDIALASNDKLKKLLRQAALTWVILLSVLVATYFLGGFKNFFTTS